MFKMKERMNNKLFKSLPTYREIESGLFQKSSIVKNRCTRHIYEVMYKDTIAVKVCKRCFHIK